MDSLAHPPRVQIFVTGIDEEALAVARAGRYPEPLLSGLGPQRRKRFFRCDGAALVICKEVRDMCIFSPHSVVGDPPFSRKDLVSCPNLLIYMGFTLQIQVISTFHYALRPGDYLILGSAKGVSRHAHLFGAVDKKSRIFQCWGNDPTPRRLPMWVDDQRRAGGIERGGAIAQRGAGHPQCRVDHLGRGAGPRPFRPAKPLRGHQDRHHLHG